MSEYPSNFDTSSVEKKPDEKEKKDSKSTSTRSSSVPRVPLFDRPSEKAPESNTMMDKLGELFVKRDKPELPKPDKPISADGPGTQHSPERVMPIVAEQDKITEVPPEQRLPAASVELRSESKQDKELEPKESLSNRDSDTTAHKAVAEADKNDDESDNESANDLFRNTEPAANEIGAGEFVLHLNGDTPIGERVIPLHGETAEPQWRTQPEQQHAARFEDSPEPTEPGAGDNEQASSDVFDASDRVPLPAETDPSQYSGSTEQPEERSPDQQTYNAAEQPFNYRINPEDGAEEPAEQQSEQSVPAAEVPTFTSSTTGETPRPHIPIPEYGSMPFPPDTYHEQQYAQQNIGTGEATTSGSGNETTATKQDVEDAIYYATKAGQRRGVIAGGLFFGGYEHFKHRRREKRQEKIIKSQTKQLAKQQEEQRWQTSEQTRQLATSERINREQQLRAAQAPVESGRTIEASPALPPIGERRFAALNQMDEQRIDAAPERRFGHATTVTEVGRPERKFARRLERLLPKHAEKSSVESLAVPERLEVPAEHRLETSAWHTIEVDAKTGKAVENPTFAYGHEYYRERAHEAVPRDDSRNAAAGEVALVAAAMHAAASEQRSDTMSAVPAQTQNVPNHAQAPQKPAKRLQSLKGQSLRTGMQNTGPLWPWIVAFIVVVILLASALR